ncbi:MAG: tetrahydrofolate dehydrogenase/cyclohydrolase catalytic domain-containing protein [Patescibacteria group bacterium]
MELLDGRKVSSELLEGLEKEVLELKRKNVHPHLTVILVGDSPASRVYVKHKRKACEKIGIEYEQLDYKADEMDTEKLIAKIHELNENPRVHGILVQLPLPDHIYGPEVIKAIEPKKDVDGFTAYNLGKVFLSTEFEDLPPATALGIIKLLDYYKIDFVGKEAVVVGSSNIVGKPVSTMLLNRKATVTTCNSKTKDLKSHTSRADLLVVAVGKKHLITEDMVKEGAVVVDVGINRDDDGKLYGDVDFENVSKKVSYITPVPGGVGPMTIACLMENILTACKRLNNIN